MIYVITFVNFDETDWCSFYSIFLLHKRMIKIWYKMRFSEGKSFKLELLLLTGIRNCNNFFIQFAYSQIKQKFLYSKYYYSNWYANNNTPWNWKTIPLLSIIILFYWNNGTQWNAAKLTCPASRILKWICISADQTRIGKNWIDFCYGNKDKSKVCW